MEKILKKINREGLDCFLFTSQQSVFYLSKFKSTHAYVLLTAEGKKYFITDSRYILRAERELKSSSWKVIEIKAPLIENLSKLLLDSRCKRIGVEEDRIKLEFFEKLKCKTADDGIRLIPIASFLDEFRMIKTPDEIDRIKTAVEITDKAFADLVEFLKKNRNHIGDIKEKDIRRFLLCKYLESGAEGESFLSIVAAGENSAVPHHETGETPLKENAPLLIDTGCVWEGYCSDFTRVIFIGKPDEELLKIYDIVKEAHIRALEAVKIGRPIGEVDLAAREYIEKIGYGHFFTHSTGHGVGIEIHEPPRVYKNDKTPIREGMVFTIEPGIYIPNLGGIRLENIVVVEKHGAKPLQKTSLEKIFI